MYESAGRHLQPTQGICDYVDLARILFDFPSVKSQLFLVFTVNPKAVHSHVHNTFLLIIDDNCPLMV
jgi:hypothetical protein